MEAPLTLLLTQHIHGDLALLPRLGAFLNALRGQARAAGDDVLHLDLGAACDPTAWHCAATGGASVALALDALGCDAAYNDGWLATSARPKLTAALAQVAVVDARTPWQRGQVAFGAVAPAAPYRLFISALPASAVLLRRIDGPHGLHVLSCAPVPAGHVGHIRLTPADDTGAPHLAAADVFPLPPGQRADPSLSGTIAFIEDEARRARG